MKVLVLGGHGFIGRHAVSALARAGAAVTIGTRNPRSGPGDYPQERHVLHEALAESDWHDAAQRFDVILNAVGILRQRLGETYDAVHHRAPEALALACKAHDTRLVLVSALGLSLSARSRFLSSKVRGEQAVESVGGRWILARLSLLDGDGGFGASWLRGVSKLPLFVVPTSAQGRIAALTANDAGEALSALCLRSDEALDTADSRVYELGGRTAFSFEGYIHGLGRRYRSSRAKAVRVPGVLARVGAHLCDLVHFSPFSFGHWELLCHDNVPNPNRLGELLGREPDPVVDLDPDAST